MKLIRIILCILLVLILVGAGVAYYAYDKIKNESCIAEETWIYLHHGDKYADLLTEIGMQDDQLFQLLADRYHLEQKVETGKASGAYRFEPGSTRMTLVRRLSNNQQTPVRISFLGTRTLPELAGRMARNIEADSLSLLAAMTDTAFVQSCGTDLQNIQSLFLPDTYEVYWNITPERLMERMKSEWEKYWNDSRRLKAKALGITPWEASILCSIAEEETADRQERGVVARLYWNRLQKGMLLQADPTVKYAVGDFTLRRILNEHLATDSPYNTYLHPGLPPGPIRIVEKATIDALLDSQPHNYLFMCAKEDFSGRHNFAVTLSEHNRNAARYHQALNERGIR